MLLLQLEEWSHAWSTVHPRLRWHCAACPYYTPTKMNFILSNEVCLEYALLPDNACVWLFIKPAWFGIRHLITRAENHGCLSRSKSKQHCQGIYLLLVCFLLCVHCLLMVPIVVLLAVAWAHGITWLVLHSAVERKSCSGVTVSGEFACGDLWHVHANKWSHTF